MVGKFVWEDYLKETNCIAALDDAFQEVCVSYNKHIMRNANDKFKLCVFIIDIIP